MFRKPEQIDGYDYYITQDSDDDFQNESSEEEDKIDDVGLIFDGTAKQKRHAFQRLTSGMLSESGEDPSSSEDEFEEMMKSDLDKTLDQVEKSWFVDKIDKNSSANIDSGECSKNTEEEMKNDELLYDPHADDDDQKWVDQHRAKIKKKTRSKQQGDLKTKSMKTDAVLNCPACMIVLSLDCQRHATYQNQFRAMFVMNCNVQKEEKLHFKKNKKKIFKRHRKRASQQDHGDLLNGEQMERSSSQLNGDEEPSEYYHPVKCSSCGTEVGVYDCDEVYHFHNVIEGSM